jgi:RNA polymerase sigma factor (sigma-70 family)
MNNYSNYKDVELVPLMREPKPASDNAFHEIYGRYARKLYAYCLYKLEDSSQVGDILQETWLAFAQSVREGKSISDILPYLIGIARNLIRNYLKTQNRRDEIFINSDSINFDTISFTDDSSLLLENKELTAIVMNAIYHLEDIYRETFVMKKVDGLSYAEIAKIMEESVNTVQKRYARAVEMLYEILKPYIKEFIK